MTKIREIIEIKSGYTSYVDVYEDYHNLEQNRGRMEHYMPIAAHRQVFEKIANALNPKDRRCYFLSGSYGTGKSHLLLMLANYFASPTDVPELEAFFKNYETAQKDVLLRPGETLKERTATSIKQARSSGKFLVAICRFVLNLDFEGALLRALEEALKQDDSKLIIDSHYSEALRRIKDWQERRNESRFFNDLELELGRSHSDWTIDDLIKGLQDFNEQALIVFRECFQTVTDSEFTYKKDNLRDIITDFLKNKEFKANYKGIVFLYDEFGGAIDNGLVNYRSLLDFAQFCASSTLEKGGTVVFVGTGHKGFRSHGQIGDLNAETLEARVTEIPLLTQGMEDIIGAIVKPKKDSEEWKNKVQPETSRFTWFATECNRLHLFNWLPAPKIKNNIIQNIYPMHPLATYALLKLAGEAGSDNRSVFKFFAPEFKSGSDDWKDVQDKSYPWYLENHEIIEHSKLSLYTADMLVDYFKDGLKATNNRLIDKVKNAVINYEATVRELNAYLARKSDEQLFEEADELMQKILKVMLVNEIASTQDAPIANTAQNIEFALDAVSEEEKKPINIRLEQLTKASILYNNNGVYELMRSDRKDIQQLIKQYKADPDHRPTNLLDSFMDFSPLKNDEIYLDAKGYNDTYSEDKRLKVFFTTPQELAEKQVVDNVEMSLFAAYEKDRLEITNAATGYEGTAVYVYCENENDIEKARKAIAKNDQGRVVIAVPRTPISVYDAVFTLQAMESDWFKKQAENFSPFEKADEKKSRDDALKTLESAKRDYFSNSKVFWFGKKGTEIPLKEDRRNDVARWMMMEFYGDKRNTFGHNEFNKTHINITGQVRAVFKEACDILCDLSQPVRVNWTLPDNRGGTKYLRKVFVDRQALRISTVEGDIRYLDPEQDLNKFRSALPAYAKLLEELKALEGKGHTNFHEFLEPFYSEYGQGDIAITLMLFLARRYYGDSLRFKREPTALTDIQFTSMEDMLSLLQGRSSSVVLLFEPVSQEDQAYFAKVTQIFTSQPARADKTYTVSDAYQAITNWWNELPIIERSLGFYDEDFKPIADQLSKAKTKDPFHFIKHDLLELLGHAGGEVLSAKILTLIETRLLGFKKVAENIQETVEDNILSKIAKIFASPTDLDDDIKDAMKNWYNGMSSIQKDQMSPFHNNDSKPLVKNTAYANIRELLFKTLPEAYSLGSVSDWMSDYVDNYTQHIQRGIDHIKNNAPQISALNVEFDNEEKIRNNQVSYKGELVITVSTEDGKGAIYFSKDGSDPTFNALGEKLNPGEKITINKTCKIKFAVADNKGNYGPLQTFEVINELEKSVIKRPEQSAFDEVIDFVFPKTAEAVRMTITTLVKEIKDAGFIKEAELRNILQETLDSLKKTK